MWYAVLPSIHNMLSPSFLIKSRIYYKGIKIHFGGIILKFSLCMIVKNEEKMLARCLESVKDVFDEIIIVDTGSIDRTKEEAAKFTDRIYDFIWCDDFAMARNFSFSKATGDYIMWLDADDIIDSANREKLINLKETLSLQTDVVMMRYATSFDENGKESYFYYRERLIKRLSGLRWSGFVHEVITPAGNIIYEDITVCHKPTDRKDKDPARNLKIYENKLSKGAKLSARETYYYARELYYNGKNEKAAKMFEEFLSFPNGWYADKIGACLMLYHIYGKYSPQKATEILTKALSYESVNPQVLCFMGDAQKAQGRLEQAIFWYRSALMCPMSYKKDGFVQVEYERYYPLLQLCVCYDMIGEYELAKECNRLAGIEKPDSEQIKYNQKYFEQAEPAPNSESGI